MCNLAILRFSAREFSYHCLNLDIFISPKVIYRPNYRLLFRSWGLATVAADVIV